MGVIFIESVYLRREQGPMSPCSYICVEAISLPIAVAYFSIRAGHGQCPISLMLQLLILTPPPLLFIFISLLLSL